MKYLLTIAIAAACSLSLPSSGGAQELQIQTGRAGDTVRIASYTGDSYDRRLNRYQRNYGYNNYRYGNNWNSRNGNYRDYDYYGRNYGRVRDYRNYYRGNQYQRYNNGYYMRPGFTIGGGSSRVFFGF